MPQHAGVTFSNPFLHRAIDVFDSLGQALEPSATVAPKTHFVEWFSGSVLDSIWSVIEHIGSTGSVTMSDVVDDGLRILSGSSVINNIAIDFNSKRHYSNTGSVCINIAKRVSAGISNGGLQGTRESMYSDDTIAWDDRDDQTFKRLLTRNATTETLTVSTVGVNTNFTGYKTEMTSSNGIMYINGDLEVTTTSTLPTAKMNPVISSFRLSVAADTRIRYFEAYNT